MDSLDRLLRECGPFPKTWQVGSGGGGQHFYFVNPGGRPRKNIPGFEGIDLKGEGGYVIAPPSLHASGERYEWIVSPDEAGLAEPPAALVDLLSRGVVGEPSSNGEGEMGNLSRLLADPASEGNRNEQLAQYAGHMAGAFGYDRSAYETLVREFADKQGPPLPDDEVEATLDSIWRTENENTRGSSSHDRLVEKEARKLRVREDARRLVRAEEAGEHVALPDRGWSLADELALPEEAITHRIEGLQPSGGNVLLVASLKSGKTVLTLNLLRALADNVPFLGKFNVAPIEGRIAVFNYELTRPMWNRWARQIEIANPDRIAVVHLRGSGITPIWEPAYRDVLVEWMKTENIAYWILDPAAVAWLGLMESEGDNIGAAKFTGAIDEVKKLAGVSEACLTHHTGRAEQREDEERARGATRLEDWMDAGWYLTKDSSEQRYLRAKGRDVELEAIALSYEEETRRYGVTGQTKEEARVSGRAGVALAAVIELEREGFKAPSTTRVKEKMKMSGSVKDKAIQAAADALLIKRNDNGPGKAKTCQSTQLGQLQHQKASA